MTKQRSTFAKMQRERDKAAKRVAKQERRAALRLEPKEGEEGYQGDRVDDDGLEVVVDVSTQETEAPQAVL